MQCVCTTEQWQTEMNAQKDLINIPGSLSSTDEQRKLPELYCMNKLDISGGFPLPDQSYTSKAILQKLDQNHRAPSWILKLQYRWLEG
jgi:hypothetical protein